MDSDIFLKVVESGENEESMKVCDLPGAFDLLADRSQSYYFYRMRRLTLDTTEEHPAIIDWFATESFFDLSKSCCSHLTGTHCPDEVLLFDGANGSLEGSLSRAQRTRNANIAGSIWMIGDLEGRFWRSWR